MGQVPSHLIHSIREEFFHNRSGTTPPNGDGDHLHARVSSALQLIHDGVSDLPALWDAVHNSQDVGIDDRKLLLEETLAFMARTNGHRISKQLESFVIDFLYKDLPHPPSGYASLRKAPVVRPEHLDVLYAYRSADGSNYNVLVPTLGMAGTPYARSVPSANPLPPSYLPDAGLVFDTLLKREANGYVPHPGGVSSLFFAFADLVIHSIFNTNGSDPTINNASSYLDLSPLYGSSLQEVNSVRRKDGMGRLWNDVFADKRLLFMPPSACALLVLFCRNHNYIAEKIFRINEQGTFQDPQSLDQNAKEAQDEEIFQRTRLVNCGFFMQTILDDYVGAILGLTRDGYSWRLPVREAARQLDHSLAPCGEGNVVSVEFNLMYRWHSTLSENDTKWVEDEFHRLFPGKDLGTLTRGDFATMYSKLAKLGDVKTWTFANLKRMSDGQFDSASLAKILHDATEAQSSAFKARGIPEALRIVEIMGIEQGRRWGTCSLNEFRRFMGLKAYSSFEEWNPDPSVSTAAQALYHDIENLELYVGLQAEEAKTPGPGAGLCPGYTMSRAILADAVCLTRGDRFMTVGFTPQNMTCWGYQDCQFDMKDQSYGGTGMLTKLLFRTLPEFYPYDSAYAHFPFLVPDRFKEEMAKIRPAAVAEYTWTRPSDSPVRLLTAHNPVHEQELYERRLCALTGFHGKPVLRTLDRLLDDCDVPKWCNRMVTITKDLIKAKSFTGDSVKYVDIVRDVINVAPVLWVAEQIGIVYECDDIKYPLGAWSMHEMHAMFSQIAQYVYFGVPPEQEFALKRDARHASHEIRLRIQSNLHDESKRTLGDLLKEQETSNERIGAILIGDLVGTAPVFSRAVVLILDRFLNETEETVVVLQDEDSLRLYIHNVLVDVHQGGICHGLMDETLFLAMSTAILGCIISLTDVRRASGKSGKLSSVIVDHCSSSINTVQYLDSQGCISPWPSSLLIQYK